MNPARRAICADLRARGFTGKEAYEASKDPEFLEQWKRIVVSKAYLREVDQKPKVEKVESWIKAFQQQRVIKSIRQAAEKRSVQRAADLRKGFVAKCVSRGMSVNQAVRAWRRRHE